MKKHGAEEEIYLLVPHNIFAVFSSIFSISEIFIRVSKAVSSTELFLQPSEKYLPEMPLLSLQNDMADENLLAVPTISVS